MQIYVIIMTSATSATISKNLENRLWIDLFLTNC